MYFFFNESNKEESRMATIAGHGQAQVWDLASPRFTPSPLRPPRRLGALSVGAGPYEAKVVVVGPLPSGWALRSPLWFPHTLVDLGGDWTLDLNGKQVTTPLTSWKAWHGIVRRAGTYRKQFMVPRRRW